MDGGGEAVLVLAIFTRRIPISEFLTLPNCSSEAIHTERLEVGR
jgi:hypothetical protein